MKKKLRCLTSLALALCLALSLCACGEKTEQAPSKPGAAPKTEEHSEMVYTYDSKRLDAPELKNGLYAMAFTEEGMYCQTYEGYDYAETTYEADEAQAGESEEAPAEETGEEPAEEPAEESEESAEEEARKSSTDEYEDPGVHLCFISYDGTVKPMDAYSCLPAPKDEENRVAYYSGTALNTLLVQPDGGLVAVESVYEGWFDGTEAEMQQDSPGVWEKYRNNQSYYLRNLNADGSEKSSVKLDFESQDTWLNFAGCQYTDDGMLLVVGDQGIFGFGPDGSLSLQITGSDGYLDQLLRLRDGSLAAVGWGGDKGQSLYPVDLDKKSLGKAEKIPEEAYNLKAGDENYDFYYINGMYLYGYRVEDGNGVKLLNWLDVDINGNNLGEIFVQKDGSIVCILSTYRDDKVLTDLVRIYQVPYENVPHKETLTLGLLYGYDVYDRVVDFNRLNDKYRIVVQDYSEFNDPENDDYTAGRTKLITEILSGQMPDLICLDELPYRQMASKGLLEDLYPYLDKDRELSRDDFFPNVLRAMEVNGGLYEVTTGFNVATLIGATKVVGDKPGWTYQDMLAALSTMPEGCDPLDMYTTRGDLLRTLLCTDLEHYVNWTTGECAFESQDFIDMLEFTARFPAEIPDDMEWEDSSTRLAEGRQMLTSAYLYSVDSMVWNDVQFGEQGCTYIGYPTNNGVGSYMYLTAGFAMSSSCANKDAAWEFLRGFITEDAQQRSWSGIPLSLKVYREKLEKAMTPEYERDAKGDYLKDANGDRIPIAIGSIWLPNGQEQMVYCMTQEQADKLWEAVSTCDKVWEADDAIYEIVFEQAQAFFSGQKTAQDVAKLIQTKVTIYVNEQR